MKEITIKNKIDLNEVLDFLYLGITGARTPFLYPGGKLTAINENVIKYTSAPDENGKIISFEMNAFLAYTTVEKFFENITKLNH